MVVPDVYLLGTPVLSQSKSPFFTKLPREIRNMIYEEYLELLRDYYRFSYEQGPEHATGWRKDEPVKRYWQFTHDHITDYLYSPLTHPANQPDLLFACKAVFAELAPLVFTEIAIAAPNMTDWPPYSGRIGFGGFGLNRRDNFKGRTKLRLVLDAPWDFGGMAYADGGWLEFFFLLVNEKTRPKALRGCFYSILGGLREHDSENREYYHGDQVPVATDVKWLVIDWAPRDPALAKPHGLPFPEEEGGGDIFGVLPKRPWEVSSDESEEEDEDEEDEEDESEWGSDELVTLISDSEQSESSDSDGEGNDETDLASYLDGEDEEESVGTNDSDEQSDVQSAEDQEDQESDPETEYDGEPLDAEALEALMERRRQSLRDTYDQVQVHFETLFLYHLSYLDSLEVIQFRGNYPRWWGETMRERLKYKKKPHVRVICD